MAILNVRCGSSNVHVSYCVAGSVRKTKNLVLQEVLIFSLCPILSTLISHLMLVHTFTELAGLPEVNTK